MSNFPDKEIASGGAAQASPEVNCRQQLQTNATFSASVLN
jgi:hypothetical protein